MQVSLQFRHYLRHATKGKLCLDVGQPGILTGDTRVSHTHPLGSRGTPFVSPVSIPGCPTDSPGFPLIIEYNTIIIIN